MAKNRSNSILDIFSSNHLAAGLLSIVSPDFERPVFILSAPRSGSSYLFEIVRRMQNAIAFQTENSPLWFRAFPYSESFSEVSDYIAPKQINAQKCDLIKSLIALKLLIKADESPQKLLYKNFLLRQKICCYVEKTISNCFHLDALTQAFPDALYIHLVRDGRSNISSMIEAWNTFVKVGIPALPPGSSVPYWSYAMPPGWQEQLQRPIEEIAAWSWIEHNQHVLSYFEDDSLSRRYLRLNYEDLRDSPFEVLEEISTFTALEMSEKAEQYINLKKPSWSTISLPKKDKWKTVNAEKINNILPMIQPMMTHLGYGPIENR